MSSQTDKFVDEHPWLGEFGEFLRNCETGTMEDVVPEVWLVYSGGTFQFRLGCPGEEVFDDPNLLVVKYVPSQHQRGAAHEVNKS